MRNLGTRFVLLVIVMSRFTLPVSAEEGHQRFAVSSPNRQMTFECWIENGRITFAIQRDGAQVIEPSELSFSIDGIDVMNKSSLELAETDEISERYPTRGVHAEAENHCRAAKFVVEHKPTGEATFLQVRVFDDGVAYRHVASESAKPRIPDEATRLVLPPECMVWFHDLRSHYEGEYQSCAIEDLADEAWLAPPVTCQLADGQGYVALTEAALTNYSGMAFQADGNRGLQIVLGHAQPASYPFELRYKNDVERLKHPAVIGGEIVTPWRVFIVSTDLNGLVNSDVVTNCSPPPDRQLFPDAGKTSWLRPGRAVWRYLDGGDNTLAGVKQFSELAGELDFEYQVVEGFWRDWSDEQITDAVQAARHHGVGLWFWQHSRDLRTPQARESFFSRLQTLGVVGAKIDFFDHEHRETVDLYQALLREAARHRIMVNFHGANKPTGEVRTWPNEMIRESVRGAEYRKPYERARHNATVPFTRYLAGHADYTPVIFNERRGDTTFAHQLATAVVFTQPLLTYAAHPQNLLASPACELIRSIPSVWDETIVLTESKVGELAVFARRSGDEWHLGIINGGSARTLDIPLTFLPSGKYRVLAAKDDLRALPGVDIEEIDIVSDGSFKVALAAGGGFAGRFVPTRRAE
jgi:alpha-glucosidase